MAETFGDCAGRAPRENGAADPQPLQLARQLVRIVAAQQLVETADMSCLLRRSPRQVACGDRSPVKDLEEHREAVVVGDRHVEDGAGRQPKQLWGRLEGRGCGPAGASFGQGAGEGHKGEDGPGTARPLPGQGRGRVAETDGLQANQRPQAEGGQSRRGPRQIERRHEH